METRKKEIKEEREKRKKELGRERRGEKSNEIERGIGEVRGGKGRGEIGRREEG